MGDFETGGPKNEKPIYERLNDPKEREEIYRTMKMAGVDIDNPEYFLCSPEYSSDNILKSPMMIEFLYFKFVINFIFCPLWRNVVYKYR